MTEAKEIISYSAEDTYELGKIYAKSLGRNSVTGLFGDLGSGKTGFVKGICSYFNVRDTVSSPTFIIVNEYKGYSENDRSEINIYHFDLYRLKNLKELSEIGFENYLNNDSVCLIEWADLAKQYLRGGIAEVHFGYGKNENERIIKYL
ncbi:MAG: tRNA (adenosine(37)-N6)-threonylcarbamoyltransferase complex ATPase subunit type 1 TsaE [Ignavibacteria bacterium]|nr:tRNA (adenosine(37)-N6)-threonylcarbamoyltransferase complex ATPase subunit type 1 TsaE [Ignavibacteria bacterium]MBK7159260.1 tRNA (adenosine(37)-N6)-threonylcarbamoyltransferase complex ATPase subunit type 1 TsaE [Ignavibacteria bacterium]MBK7445119.1 tRNA (adenosine(37)-N6)-threonylcarbamoyltransferase complex ATPase subunit type 1 TsaE [Ignavibacteria bacterium]MBK8383339.1 tRNA (adenosine(37)-N6)-threonylcarbamoyltransferase complex ATPase subunit type 1 TsaE [Ignavibacteria bacterium]M